MAREFIIAKIFDKRWAEHGLSDEALRLLQNHIIQNPNAGDIISGTGGLTKMRWNLPATGKSSGIRVLFVDFIRQETVVLVNCYSKSEKDNISNAEKVAYKEIIKQIGEELRNEST